MAVWRQGQQALSRAAVFRYHVSMLKMISPDRALSLVLEHCKPLGPGRLPLEKCTGLALAEEICADRDYPPFNRASMDGYAVRLADAGNEVPIAGSILAGQEPSSVPMADGHVWEIMTGAACPPGAEAVVQYEITQRNGDSVLLPADIGSGKNIAPAGSECAEGNIVLSPGQTITPLVAANLAAFGYGKVLVQPRPTMAVISTGTELASVEDQPGPVQIRDSNGPMLLSLASNAGMPVFSISRAGDSREELHEALENADGSDVIVLTGGVSMGTRDLVPDALAEHGVDLVFHKVTQKPGKPLLFGVKGDVLYFGLPGNPLAVHFGFHRYVEPAMRLIAGLPSARERKKGIMTADLRVRGKRTIYQLVHVHEDSGSFRVESLIGRGSADIFASAKANAYIELSPESQQLSSGDIIEYELIGDERWLT